MNDKRVSARAPRRAPIDIRTLDVLSPLLGSPGDLWIWCLLWRDVASVESYEGIEECEACCASHDDEEQEGG